MLTLFDDEYAPFTRTIGFVTAPLSAVTHTCVSKARNSWKAEELPLDVPSMPGALISLLPISRDWGDRLLLAGCGEWTAIFRSAISTGLGVGEGTADWLETDCMCIVASPNVQDRDTGVIKSYGDVGFRYSVPIPGTKRRARTVHLSRQNSRWEFYTVGEPVEFEEVDCYDNRFKRKRLTSAMLQQ